MNPLHDAWFLLRNSPLPLASASVFFLLGLWFAFLLWHRWVRHLHVMRREHRELATRVADLKDGRQVPQQGQFASGDTSLPPPRSPREEARVRSLIATAAAALAARAKTLDGNV